MAVIENILEAYLGNTKLGGGGSGSELTYKEFTGRTEVGTSSVTLDLSDVDTNAPMLITVSGSCRD